MLRPLAQLLPLLACALLGFAEPLYAADAGIDEDRAMTTLKENGCTKCHALNKRKKGPSYHEVARKYGNKPDAHETLYKHLTGSPVVKLEEGDEEHSVPKVTDRKEMDNLIRFILMGKHE